MSMVIEDEKKQNDEEEEELMKMVMESKSSWGTAKTLEIKGRRREIGWDCKEKWIGTEKDWASISKRRI